MNRISLFTLILALSLPSCSGKQTATSTEKQVENLIKQVLIWADSDNSINLLPVLTDSKDSIYIGFDLEKHRENLNKLEATDFFTLEFIENYNQIILALDKGLRTGEYDVWLVGSLPTFIFANDYSPWWNGQERFLIEKGIIEQINSDNNNGEFYFICGDKQNGCEGLENYKMKFSVIKKDNKWKISYLQGFNFKESTRKDGQL
jgi:hypothetical protein